MAQMMGVENMGGPAVGFLSAFPAPTVERGAVMAGMDHSKMPGMRRDSTPAMDHARMGHDSTRAREAPRDTVATQLMDLYMRMLSDSVIRQRVLADTALRRMMT